MTFEKVKKIIKQYLSAKDEKLTMEANFVTDLGADSIDLVEILMAIEEEFLISVPDQELINIKTIGDLVQFIDKEAK